MVRLLNAKSIGGESSVPVLETELFAEAAYRRYGVDLRGFDREWLSNRLTALNEHRMIGSISTLQGNILYDASVARAAFSFVSENDDAFFTRPTSFMALRCAVLPLLRSVAWPVLWIAECADSAFLIQLLVMLEEEELLSRTQLFVTNANEDVLSQVASLRVAPTALLERDEQNVKGGGRAPLCDFFKQTETGYMLQDRLSENIVWSQHDLSTDSSFNECHLVVCQRALTHYSNDLRKRALTLFAESLCNFGILQLNTSLEPMSHELMRHFSCILSEQGLYKRDPTWL